MYYIKVNEKLNLLNVDHRFRGSRDEVEDVRVTPLHSGPVNNTGRGIVTAEQKKGRLEVKENKVGKVKEKTMRKFTKRFRASS